MDQCFSLLIATTVYLINMERSRSPRPNFGADTDIMQDRSLRFWSKVPVSLRAIVSGLLIGLVAANVWPILLLTLGVQLAVVAELIFLSLYIWWAAGGGPPRAAQAFRINAFRRASLSSTEWFWAIVAAFSFAITIHASIVLLFRFVPFPTAAFRQGYNLSIIPSLSLKWLVVVVSAMSAGICEEVGFRGYMQRPIEQRHGIGIAILISSLFFMLVHLSKGWALAGMVPIIFGAGILLGTLAWSSQSLIPGIIGHAVMDVGLFAYWWTGIAGNFSLRPINDTGLDPAFFIACLIVVASLSVELFATSRLRRMTLIAMQSKAGTAKGINC
jgi:membrane protease YdiL (CAAX protease family)